jgi:hypothetical protein
MENKQKINEILSNLDSSNTGRYMIITKSGRKFLVEPIGYRKTAFGDINPATKKVEGDYGQKYRGSIDSSESVITKENGFKNIITLNPGESPQSYIDMLEKEGIESIEKLQ